MSLPSPPPRLILLLGGSGYIGTHLMMEFHGQDISTKPPQDRRDDSPGDSGVYQVAIIDKVTPNPDAVKWAEDRAHGLPVLVWKFDLETHPYDSTVEFPKMPRIPYCGIMLAALKDVGEGELIPHAYMRSNITLCVNSMEYLTNIGVTRLIQASSSSIYHVGDSKTEEPVGVYGYTKRVTEDMCRKLMSRDFPQQLLILRYMNPIGSHPDVNCFSTIGICQKLVKMKSDETFVNRGNCIRDYIHITDLARFHSEALRAWDTTLFEHKDLESTATATLVVGTGYKTSVSDLIKLFEEYSGHGERKVVEGERLHHEGYDTVKFSNDLVKLIPNWQANPVFSLALSLMDYRRLLD